MTEIAYKSHFNMKDGIFSFWTANLNSNHTSKTVFRVRKDKHPSERAEEKGIKYWSLDPSTESEINHWYKDHPEF